MSQISIRLNPKLKKEAIKLANAIGFSFNDLVTVCLKKAIRDNGVDLRNANPSVQPARRGGPKKEKVKKIPKINNRFIA